MASKYRKRFSIPEGFTPILQDFIKEVLREQPLDIIEFAAVYFRTKEQGESFQWQDSNRRAPKPCDYDKRAQSGSTDQSAYD
mmetsp:Transcript_7130/g.10527  ORF Transcript_7130/g.10527 Transcript_7130/m.10527 type:complete len:82 (+) Transcript_7130:1389-1634(+)